MLRGTAGRPVPHAPGFGRRRVERLVGHHADIDPRWDRVRFAITAHDAGNRLTGDDFDLAGRIDQIAAAHSAKPL
ncbi:4a-hydroxytetrahydrobiopterin dehydratase [Streptomyces verrucosisporus]|nr:4a-hydroxytetrahydrobiopterin dehydratase [Streptomyces verrucosisporus]